MEETIRLCRQQADTWEAFAQTQMAEELQAKIEYLVSYWRLLAHVRGLTLLQDQELTSSQPN